MSMSKSDVLKLVQEHLQDEWLTLNDEDIDVEPLTGGLINTLTLVTRHRDDYKIIIRNYGGGPWDADHVRRFRRPDGVQALVANEVSRLGIGPKLLSVFEGGRIEECIKNCHHLTAEEFTNDEDILNNVAMNAATIHHMDIAMARKLTPYIADLINHYQNFNQDGQDKDAINLKLRENVEKVGTNFKMFEEIIFHDFTTDLIKIKDAIDAINNKRVGVVLWDNNFLNCLIRDDYNQDHGHKFKCVLIDYEFCQYFYTSFDAASRFITVTINYSDAIKDPKDRLTGYPILSFDKRRQYLKQYLITSYQLQGSLDAVNDDVIDKYMQEVNLFMMMFMIQIIGQTILASTPNTDASWTLVCIELYNQYKTLISDFNYQEMLDNPIINPINDVNCRTPNAKDGIKIVSGKCEDAHQIYHLLRQHYDYHSKSGIPKDWKVSIDMIRSGVGSFTDGSKYFELIIAKDGAKIVGEIIYHKSFNFYLGKVVSLSQIFITDSYRGRGIGKKMMIQLSRIADAEDAIIQWRTRDWNSGAQRFYQNIGATIINEISGVGNDSKHFGMQLNRDAIRTLAKEDIF